MEERNRIVAISLYAQFYLEERIKMHKELIDIHQNDPVSCKVYLNAIRDSEEALEIIKKTDIWLNADGSIR